ncbi:hypothetical protein GCM10027059_43380 [Myceligenerans halotolerans]
MTARPDTVLDAETYWRTYYADTFRFGQGTEHVLDLLTHIPPVSTWTDLGAGSESLLWACALEAQKLTAIDNDAHRLATLATTARAARPRGVHQVALALGGTPPTTTAFAERCRSLKTTLRADLLAPDVPLLSPACDALGAQLVTQFGLLGLTTTPGEFTDAFAGLHARLPTHGWAAGANWVSADATDRVHLTHDLYQSALARAGLDTLQVRCVASTDSDFPLVWTYLARRQP